MLNLIFNLYFYLFCFYYVNLFKSNNETSLKTNIWLIEHDLIQRQIVTEIQTTYLIDN